MRVYGVAGNIYIGRALPLLLLLRLLRLLRHRLQCHVIDFADTQPPNLLLRPHVDYRVAGAYTRPPGSST